MFLKSHLETLRTLMNVYLIKNFIKLLYRIKEKKSRRVIQILDTRLISFASTAIEI